VRFTLPLTGAPPHVTPAVETAEEC